MDLSSLSLPLPGVQLLGWGVTRKTTSEERREGFGAPSHAAILSYIFSLAVLRVALQLIGRLEEAFIFLFYSGRRTAFSCLSYRRRTHILRVVNECIANRVPRYLFNYSKVRNCDIHTFKHNDDVILDELNLECTKHALFYKSAKNFNNSLNL